jgi:hypothetical protein
MPKPPGRRALSAAAIVFTLLVLATVGAFAYAQRVKRDPLLVDKTTFGKENKEGNVGKHAFTPNGDCSSDRIRIRFRTTTTNDGNVQIVEPGGQLVKTLAREAFLKRYHFHTYYWDGSSDQGGTVPRGRYKLRVTLLGEDRVLVMPGTIHVHEVPPRPDTQCLTAKDGTG